jgi:hypothetical protein
VLDALVYIDRSEIQPGRLEQVRATMNDLVTFVDANEPQLIAYSFFLSEDGTRMSVVAVHPDSTSLEFHLEVAGPGFCKFKDLITLSTIDVYGQVSERALQLLREKARVLGMASVVVHKPYVGFARLGTR